MCFLVPLCVITRGSRWIGQQYMVSFGTVRSRSNEIADWLMDAYTVLVAPRNCSFLSCFFLMTLSECFLNDSCSWRSPKKRWHLSCTMLDAHWHQTAASLQQEHFLALNIWGCVHDHSSKKKKERWSPEKDSPTVLKFPSFPTKVAMSSKNFMSSLSHVSLFLSLKDTQVSFKKVNA
jgi:hypothetical protein